jgi:hypothetical protein
MKKEYKKAENYVLKSFVPGENFIFKDTPYEILLSGKPISPAGEPKTDIYAKCKNLKNNEIKEFKISFKLPSADFVENKVKKYRAKELFGDEWKQILCNSIQKIKEKFVNDSKYGIENENWKIKLGWRLDIINKNGGHKTSKLDLDYIQKYNVYSGDNLSKTKKNASVNGNIIQTSGVANFMLKAEPKKQNWSLQDIVDSLTPMEEFIKNSQTDLFLTARAVNYRTLKKENGKYEIKFEHGRDLLVPINWKIENGFLSPKLVFNDPLELDSSRAAAYIQTLFDQLQINDSTSFAKKVNF